MEILLIVESIILTIFTLGIIIYGTIKVIQSKSNTAKDDAIILTNKNIEIVKSEHGLDLKNIHEEINEMTERLEELDKWRKDMNGQLKLMNERQKFTNQILEEQKTNLVLVTQSLNTLSTGVAVLNEVIRKMEVKHQI